MKKVLKTIAYTNLDTGEIFNVNQIAEIKEIIKVDNNFKNIRGTNNYINDNLGYYFHLLYSNVLSLNLESQYLVRFLKLCCYIDYNNKLVTGRTRGKKIKANELENILILSRNETSKTKTYLINQGLIKIDDNKTIEVNTDYVKRGPLKGKLLDMDVVRIFNDGFNKLYDGVKPRQHKKLAVFIKILPYLNIQHNIICSNPREKDPQFIKPLSWTALGRLIGLSEASIKRLRNELWDFKIDENVVIGEFSTFSCAKSIVINPEIYYKGNNIENLKGIVNLFKLTH